MLQGHNPDADAVNYDQQAMFPVDPNVQMDPSMQLADLNPEHGDQPRKKRRGRPPMQNKQRDESCSQNTSVMPAGQFAPFQPEDDQEPKPLIAGPRPHVSYDLNTIFHDFNQFPDNKWEPYADPVKCP